MAPNSEPEPEHRAKRPPRLGLSVRAQLVIGSMTVLLLLLCVFGVALRAIASATLMSGVDSDLHHQLVAVSMHGHGPPDGGGPPGGGPPPNQNPPGGSNSGELGRPGGPPPGGGPDFRDGGPLHGGDRDTANLDRFLTGGGPPLSPDEFSMGSNQATINPYAPRRFDYQGRGIEPGSEKLAPMDPYSLRLALQGETVYSTIIESGQRVRVLSEPAQFAPPGQKRGAHQASYPLDGVDRALKSVDRALLMLIPVALVCAGLGGWWITGRALGRVGKITQAAAAIGARNLSARLPAAGSDEFSQLAQTFNGLLDRVDAAFQEQRRFTADASHELKTPLTVIQGTTSLALSMGNDATLERGAIQEIDSAAASMAHLVQDLLYLARADAGLPDHQAGGSARRVELLLADPIERAIGIASPRSRARVTFRQSGAPVCVVASEAELTRLFLNLLENAARYTPEGGEIIVTIAQDADCARAVATVADTGIGIAAEHLPRLMDRFYRVDDSRTRSAESGEAGGSGLGLAICRSIAESHGGSLEIGSVVGVGTIVTVRLPGCSAEGNAQ